MRIAPRTLLCGSAWRVGGSGADTGFEELRELCTASGDQRSLATGMTGQLMAQYTNARRREASRLASEHIALLESVGDPALTVGLSIFAIAAKNDIGEMAEVLRWAQRVIDLAEGDLTKGNLILGSPLALAIACRGTARWCLGITGGKDDLHEAAGMARAVDPITRAGVMWFTYVHAIPNGVLLADATALRDTADTLATAEQSGDDFALDLARTAHGVILVRQVGPQREAGFDLLTKIRETALDERFALTAVPIVDIHTASDKARLGDLDGAIDLARAVVDDLFASGGCIWSTLATGALVEALVQRRGDGDLEDARAAIDRLAAVATDPGFALNEIWLLRLRALLAQAHGDATAYAQFRDRYRDMAKTLGFDGHIEWAEAMP
jgi:adenylate cyclase